MNFDAWHDSDLLKLWEKVQAAFLKGGDMRTTSVSGLSGSLQRAFVTDPIEFHDALSAELVERGLTERLAKPNEARVDMSGLHNLS